MIIYNVTTQADKEIAQAWLQWIKEEHIPEILATGCFSSATVLHLLEVDETSGLTYAVQYKTESKANYNRYISQHAAILRDKSFEKWGNKFISIRSLMEVVQ